MKITKNMLDMRINEFEECVTHNLTYREFIRECEEVLGVSPQDLDSMTEEELNKYDDWLFEMSLK